MKTKTRIYSVAPTAGGPVRLVEAASQAQALGHVTRTAYAVEVASQQALVAAIQAGITVEQASPATDDISGEG